MAKGAVFILIGLFIDGLQAAVSFMAFTLGAALQAATPVGGAIGGAAAGCYANASAWSDAFGCATGALVGGAAGAAASVAGIPLGIALGFALNVCISLTIGSGFVVLLAMFNMFYPSYVWSAFIGEAIPGLDNLPGWTTLAILCVLRNMREEGKGLSGIAATAVSVIAAPENPTAILAAARKVASVNRDITPRPANDNFEYAQKAA